MAQKSLAQLKALWVTGFIPQQADFADLFDSYPNIKTPQTSIFRKITLNHSQLISKPGTNYDFGDIVLNPGEFVKRAFCVIGANFVDSLGNTLHVNLHCFSPDFDYGFSLDVTNYPIGPAMYDMLTPGFFQFYSEDASILQQLRIGTNGASFATLTDGGISFFYEIGTLDV